MSSVPSESQEGPPRPSRAARALGAYALVAGATSLLGRALDVRWLADWGSPIAIQPNAALAAVAAGGGVLAAARGARARARVCGASAALVGGATLLEHATGVALGIDGLLLFDRAWGGHLTLAPGRMGLPASTAWLLVGGALLGAQAGPRSRQAAAYAAIAATSIAAFGLLGRGFQVDVLYTVPRVTAIALQTGTMVLAASLGLLAALPDVQPVASLREPTAAGLLARRALPAVLALPVLLGALTLGGLRAGHYDAPMGVAILAIALAALGCVGLAWMVRMVRTRERALVEAEEARAHSLHQLRLVSDNAPVMIARCDAEGRYRFVNRPYAQRFGLAPREVVGKRLPEIVGETLYATMAPHVEAVLAGRPVDFETATGSPPDGPGEWLRALYRPERDAAGRVVGFVAALLDITDRKRAEEALRASERRHRLLADLGELLEGEADVRVVLEETCARVRRHLGAARCGYVRIDEIGGHVVVESEAHAAGLAPLAERLPLAGLTAPFGAEVGAGRPLVLADVAADPRTAAAHGALFAPLAVRSFAALPLVRGGAWRAGLWAAHDAPRDWTADEVTLLGRVAERLWLSLENARYAADLRAADRRKDEFLATLAHELRNPLAPLRSALEILARVSPDAPPARDARASMERQVRQLVRLVDDLLDVGRITRDRLELRLERMDLRVVLRHVADSHAPLLEQAGLVFERSWPDEPLWVDGDPVRLGQVVGNLLANAWKYTEPAGRVRLVAGRTGAHVEIRVADTGIGIAPEDLPRVFELFAQAPPALGRSRGGLGIGLSLARRLVELHGGALDGQSAGLDQGSEFVVQLPAVEPDLGAGLDEAGTDAAPLRPAAPRAARRVLVVDDNEDAALSLAMLLDVAGCETQVAHDGPTAVERARTWRPTAIVLDLGLPGLDGHDACRAIRRQPGGDEVVIVALTGWGQARDRQRSAEAGFDDHLVKPADYGELVATLEAAALRRRRAPEPPPRFVQGTRDDG